MKVDAEYSLLLEITFEIDTLIFLLKFHYQLSFKIFFALYTIHYNIIPFSIIFDILY